MKFCPQCGSSLFQGDAFCEQCGFKIDLGAPVSSDIQSNDTPSEDTYISPPPPVDVPYQQSEPVAYQPPLANEYVSVQQKKGKLIPILIIIGAIIILGGGGWLVYANFIKAKTNGVVADTTSLKTTVPVATVPDSTPKVEEPQTNQTPSSSVDNATKNTSSPQNVNIPSNTITPSKSKINNGAGTKTITTVSKPERVNEPVRETQPTGYAQPENNMPSSSTNNVEPPSKTIFEVGQLGLSILKNPKKECNFTLKDRYCITRITTDHYNDGNGTERTGTIGIEDMNGNIIKQWHARGRSGSSGVHNGRWVVEPGIVLDAGHYTIIDSDRETWTKKISGVGFVNIEGYKVQ
jgi:hypothetical protein